MSTITLYQCADEALIERHIDPETGEIDIESFHAAVGNFIGKAQSVAAWVMNQEAQADMVDTAIKRLTLKKKCLANNAEKVHDYLFLEMSKAKINEVKAIDGTWTAQIKVGRESVQIDEGVTFDESLLLPPKPREPSKTLIAAAIKAGQPIAGARLVKPNVLLIK